VQKSGKNLESIKVLEGRGSSYPAFICYIGREKISNHNRTIFAVVQTIFDFSLGPVGKKTAENSPNFNSAPIKIAT